MLDLFGGTGQMGIEALSRGRPTAPLWICGKRRWASSGENLKLTGLEGQATVVQGDALAFLTRCREKYDVIFLDPPYASDLLKKAMETIPAIDIVTENGIIVCENGSTTGWPEVQPPYRLQKEYRYGKVRTALYRRLAGPPQP